MDMLIPAFPLGPQTYYFCTFCFIMSAVMHCIRLPATYRCCFTPWTVTQMTKLRLDISYPDKVTPSEEHAHKKNRIVKKWTLKASACPNELTREFSSKMMGIDTIVHELLQKNCNIHSDRFSWVMILSVNSCQKCELS